MNTPIYHFEMLLELITSIKTKAEYNAMVEVYEADMDCYDAVQQKIIGRSFCDRKDAMILDGLMTEQAEDLLEGMI